MMRVEGTPDGAAFEREHAEDPQAGRMRPIVLDRQRIVHSSAFRRLQFKTQVFVSPDDDNLRTRLTHTLEVAHLSRLLAERLGLNAELAEVVALAHDLGHPPFGHAGERALDECMAGRGGFEHNVQALRVVEYLEHPHPQFRGLNLTRAVRECLAKHTTQYDRPGPHPLQDGRPPPAEGMVAALADRLAYSLHDLQDGLYAGLLGPGDLAGLELWRRASDGPRAGDAAAWKRHLRPTIERMQEIVIEDAAGASRVERSAAGEGLPRAGEIRLSAEMSRQLDQLDGLLRERVYRHPRLIRMDAEAARVLKAVFEAYVDDPRRMPPRWAAWVEAQGVYRVVCDYVAGMTDQFCQREHTRLVDPQTGA